MEPKQGRDGSLIGGVEEDLRGSEMRENASTRIALSGAANREIRETMSEKLDIRPARSLRDEPVREPSRRGKRPWFGGLVGPNGGIL
jgi:hypothetical protein